MNLHAVETRRLGQARRLDEPLDGLGDFTIGHGARERIVPAAAIEGHLLSLGAHGGGAARSVAVGISLRQRPGMHELGDHERAMGMDPVEDRPPSVRLTRVRQSRLKLIGLGEGLVGVKAFGDDQAEAALGEGGVVVGHALRRDALRRGADPRHRRDGQPVAERGFPQVQGHEQTIRLDRVGGRDIQQDAHAQRPPAERTAAIASISIWTSGS